MINNNIKNLYKKNNGFVNQINFSMAMNERKILIYDEINENSIIEAIYYLNRIRYIDSKFHKEKKPIEIQLSTNGGNVEDGLSLIALIEDMKKDGYQIITTNIGKCYSMGFIISITGSIRRAYKYAKYMYHDISYGVCGKNKDVIDYMDLIKSLKEDVLEIVTHYTNKDVSFYEKINNEKKDKFFTVKEMLEIKGVDYIV